MYLQHYNFYNKPFELTADPQMLYLSDSHRQALAALKKGAKADAGIVVVTGEAGTGKTTLLNTLARELKTTHHLCMLSNPILGVDEFYQYISVRLDLPGGADNHDSQALAAMLREDHSPSFRRVLLVIDEAHLLPTGLLAEIARLGEMVEDNQGQLSIILVGQPELLDRLLEDDQASLRQKIGKRYKIEPLSRQEVADYISFRLDMVGWRDDLELLFSEKTVDAIHQGSGGVPRIINVLCDNALLTGYANNLSKIDHLIVRECVDQLLIPQQRRPSRTLAKKPWWQNKSILWAILVLAAVGAGAIVAYRSDLLLLIRKLIS